MVLGLLAAACGEPCEPGEVEGKDGICLDPGPADDDDAVEPPDSPGYGDTAGDSGLTTTDCASPDRTPPIVVYASAFCDAAERVRFFAETERWTSGGLFFQQETGNLEPQWSDEHSLDSLEYDPCGAWDRLERVLDTAADLASWAPDQSTVFSCPLHYSDPTVLSYAAGVGDVDGNFADCLAWGGDPGGMIDGTYDRVNEPTFPLSSCVIGVSAR